MTGPHVHTVDDEILGRASVFAALGEPVRLAIIESLLLSDLTPQDIVEALGIRSNLLAHHLNVLEQAGLLQRVRSDGDGRRRYLRLTPSPPMILRLQPARIAADEVVFVCSQDMGLSEIAARLWARRSDVQVRAAAFEPARISAVAAEVAIQQGLGAMASPLPELVDLTPTSGLLVTLSDVARERAVLPVAPGTPTLHWSMPHMATYRALSTAIDELGRRMDVLAAAISG